LITIGTQTQRPFSLMVILGQCFKVIQEHIRYIVKQEFKPKYIYAKNVLSIIKNRRNHSRRPSAGLRPFAPIPPIFKAIFWYKASKVLTLPPLHPSDASFQRPDCHIIISIPKPWTKIITLRFSSFHCFVFLSCVFPLSNLNKMIMFCNKYYLFHTVISQ